MMIGCQNLTTGSEVFWVDFWVVLEYCYIINEK